jgi:hypothetical protein
MSDDEVLRVQVEVNPALDEEKHPCAVCGTPTVLHCATCGVSVCAQDDCPGGCDA